MSSTGSSSPDRQIARLRVVELGADERAPGVDASAKPIPRDLDKTMFRPYCGALRIRSWNWAKSRYTSAIVHDAGSLGRFYTCRLESAPHTARLIAQVVGEAEPLAWWIENVDFRQ
jgi:hypothetical protein